MRKFISVLLLQFIITLSAFSQIENIDSLRRIIRTEKKDSSTCRAMYQLGVYYYHQSNLDSAMFYAQHMLVTASNWRENEINCQNLIGNIYSQMGVYDKALQAYLIALKRSEDKRNEEVYGMILSNIGSIYAWLEDYASANKYTYQAIVVSERLAQPRQITVNYLNLGDNYYRLGLYDSARAFGEKAYSLALKYNISSIASFALGNLGNAYRATGAPEIALGYYRKALATIDDSGRPEVLLGLAKVFLQMRSTDSALYYARHSFNSALSLKMTPEVLAASGFMADYYKDHGEVDSAYWYLNHVIAAKDSLFNQERLRQVQTLSFEEMVRQQKLEQSKIAADEERRHNIQYSMMAVGVLCFLVLILLLSRSVIVNEKWIRFLGVLGLLLLFEFINLIIHPFLGNITHHSPFLMFFALVIIAAFLIPMHHKIEHFILKKLTVKNKELRLAAARRTVAELEKQEESEGH